MRDEERRATEDDGPDLSVVVVCAEGGAGIARLLDRLSEQRIAHRLDVIVAVPDAEACALPASNRLGSLRAVSADLSTSARARVPAIEAARAPFVALAEDHSFPVGPHWAETLLAGLREGHAAVGPRMGNANPATAVSWAILATEYGPWLAVTERREMARLPGHNSAYDRAVLMGYGARLGEMLEAEFVLHADLRRRGRTLLVDPALCVEHLNYARPLRAIRLTFLSGWMFAASRREPWGPARRIAYALAGPLIGLRRFPPCAAALWAIPGHRWDALRAMPALAVVLLANGLGEMLGYALGDRGRRAAWAEMEYHRWRNLRDDEIALAR